MPSKGTGADISPEDANDILQKLITESIKVQAMFTSGAGVTATVDGLLRRSRSGDLFVAHRNVPGTPLLSFDPSRAVSRRYGDNRAFPAFTGVGTPRLSSALVFVLSDGSQLGLFEIEVDR